MLYKAIASGKEHRKPYYGTKVFDRSCRCHGGCEWCLENRQHKNIIKIQAMEDQKKEYLT